LLFQYNILGDELFLLLLQSAAYLNGEPVTASNGVEDLEVIYVCL